MLYYVGLDLGQASDYSALCVIEEAIYCGPEVDFAGWGAFVPQELEDAGWVSPSLLSPAAPLRCTGSTASWVAHLIHRSTCGTWNVTSWGRPIRRSSRVSSACSPAILSARTWSARGSSLMPRASVGLTWIP